MAINLFASIPRWICSDAISSSTCFISARERSNSNRVCRSLSLVSSASLEARASSLFSAFVFERRLLLSSHSTRSSSSRSFVSLISRHNTFFYRSPSAAEKTCPPPLPSRQSHTSSRCFLDSISHFFSKLSSWEVFVAMTTLRSCLVLSVCDRALDRASISELS
jgi:hypothetical protein